MCFLGLKGCRNGWDKTPVNSLLCQCIQGEVSWGGAEQESKERVVFMGPYWVRKKPGIKEIPRNTQGWPQLRLLAIVERELIYPSTVIRLVTFLIVIRDTLSTN